MSNSYSDQGGFSRHCLVDCLGPTQYVPIAKACALANKAGEKRFDAEVYGVRSTFSSYQYRVWSFENVQKRYQALTGSNKSFADEALESAGVMPVLMADGIVQAGHF